MKRIELNETFMAIGLMEGKVEIYQYTGEGYAFHEKIALEKEIQKMSLYDHQLIFVLADKTIVAYSLQDKVCKMGECRTEKMIHTLSPITGKPGEFVGGARAGDIVTFSAQDMAQYKHHFYQINQVTKVVMIGKQCWIGDKDGKVKICDYPHLYQIEQCLLGHTNYIISIIPHKLGIFTSGGDGKILLWDPTTYTMLKETTFEKPVQLIPFKEDIVLLLTSDYEYHQYHVMEDRISSSIDDQVVAIFPYHQSLYVCKLDGYIYKYDESYQSKEVIYSPPPPTSTLQSYYNFNKY